MKAQIHAAGRSAEECATSTESRAFAPDWQTFVRPLQRPSMLIWGGILLIVALYVRTTGFDFVYDDLYILLNPPLDSWKAFANVFTHDIFGLTGTAQSSYYRPLSVLPVLLIKQFTSGSPAWYHLFAILIHVCVLYEAYILGRLLFRDERLAALAALCFGLHPGKVESVAWIGSSMCDGLGAISFFGAIIGYLKWHEQKRGAWLASSLLCFAVALLTKETLLFAAILIPVHYFLKAERTRRTLETTAVAVPYMVLLLLYMILRRMVLQLPEASARAIRPEVTQSGLWNLPSACWWYLKHLVWPVQLGVVYDFREVTALSLRSVVLPLIGVAALGAVACWIWYRHRSANVTFLCLWFLLALGPYLVFAPMVRLHDRYLYLASYPFCALMAYLILSVRKGWSADSYGRFAVALALVGLMIVGTWHESGYWRDELSLWQRATQTAPHEAEPWLHVASSFSGDLASTKSLQIIDQGLQNRPLSPSLWQARGLLLFDRLRYSEARSSFCKVLEVSSRYDLKQFPDVMQAKSGAAYHLGVIDLNANDFASAEKLTRMAVELRPEIPEFHRALATALRGQGRVKEAEREEAALNRRSGS